MQIDERVQFGEGASSSKNFRQTNYKRETGKSIRIGGVVVADDLKSENNLLPESPGSPQNLSTNDTIMSGESLFKVFNFEPTSNKADSEKCVCFWKHLMKYTNLKPVDCTLVKDTRKLRKKRKVKHKDEESEDPSFCSPNFPWSELYEDLKKRKLYLAPEAKPTCRFCKTEDALCRCEEQRNEYLKEEAQQKESIKNLSSWKPKSVKREKEGYNLKTIRPIKSEESSSESTDSEEENEEEESKQQKTEPEKPPIVPAFLKHRPLIAPRKSITFRQAIPEEMGMRKSAEESTEAKDTMPFTPKPVADIFYKPPPKHEKYRKRSEMVKKGLPEKVQKVEGGVYRGVCFLCGMKKCKCEAVEYAIKEVSPRQESSKIKTDNNMKKVAQNTVEKILDFAQKRHMKKQATCQKRPTVTISDKEPIVMKQIIPKREPEDDGIVVIKTIEELKISSSNSSCSDSVSDNVSKK